MNQRLIVYKSDESASTPTTLSIDLGNKDKLSEIEIEFKSTSAGTAPSAHPSANVSKIEVMDGSSVITSLTGLEAQALEFYDTGEPAYNLVTDISTLMMISTYRIKFGRKLWDTVIGLDTSRFNDLQLRITHNYQTADTAATSPVISVLGKAFDKKNPTFTGYMSAKEIYAYTCGANGSEQPVPIPTDALLRKLLIVCAGAGYYPHEIINKIRISEDNDKVIPINTSTSKLLKAIHAHYGRFTEYGQLSIQTSNRYEYFMPWYDISVSGGGTGVTEVLAEPAVAMHEPFYLIGAAAQNANVVVSGHDPHGAFPLLFGDQDDTMDWYDTTQLGKLQATLTAGSAATNGSAKIVTQQFRKY